MFSTNFWKLKKKIYIVTLFMSPYNVDRMSQIMCLINTVYYKKRPITICPSANFVLQMIFMFGL